MSFSKITHRAAMSISVRTAMYVVALGLVLALMFYMGGNKGLHFTAEPEFSDTLASGMKVVPASCDSNPPIAHFAGQCDPACTPSFFCRDRDVHYRSANCNAAFVERCDIGCLDGRCIQASCTPGNFCSGPNLFARSANCSVTLQQVCAGGCSNGACNPGGSCTPSYYCANNALYYRTSNCTEDKIQDCPAGCSGASCLLPPTPLASITAFPALVRMGDPSRISWTSTSTASCIVSATNGDTWSGVGGSTMSSGISQATVFTLDCTPRVGTTHLIRQVTVNIIPVFEEI